MKKILACILAVALLTCVFAACGKTEDKGDAQNAVIAVDKVLIVVLKIEVDLSGGVLLTVDGGRRGRLGNDVGLPDDGGNGDYQEYHSDGAILKVGAVLLLALLGLPGGLGIVPAGAGQVLAGLFFS